MQLAIVSMADQFTRITTGGSALSRHEPVVGLLFGVTDGTDGGSNSSSRSVTDAEDVPIANGSPAKCAQQVQLHRAVFPQHAVVGWYRVADAAADANSNNNNAAGPTPEDLLLSTQLQKQYYDDSNSSEMPFLFALLQVNNSSSESEQDADAELPLQLFAVDAARNVLVGVDDWKLETATAERLAVERVMKEDNHNHSSKNSKDDDNSNSDNSNHNHIFVQATQPVQRSVQALQERWAVIEDYLQATAQGTVTAPDAALLRQIQGLLLSVGPLAASAAAAPSSSTGTTADAAAAVNNKNNNATLTSDDLLQQLTLLAQTVTAIQQYSDKVKVVHDAGYGGGSASSSSSAAAGGASDSMQRRGSSGGSGSRSALARGMHLFKGK